jgi:hypothetical protein
MSDKTANGQNPNIGSRAVGQSGSRAVGQSGNYTLPLTNRVNYLTVTLAALAATPIERLREAETITAYIFSPHTNFIIFSFGNKPFSKVFSYINQGVFSMKNTLKLTLLSAVVLLAAAALSLTSCDNDTTPAEHVHQWGEWTQTKDPTETAEGEETRICALDPSHKETRPKARLAHTHQWGEWTVTTPATCIAKGERTRTCTVDQTHTDKEETAIDPDGHAFTNPTVTPATCEDDGKEEGTCTLCNQATTKTLAKLGHDYQYTVTTPAACETAEVETGMCTHDNSHTTTRNGAAALGHDSGEWHITLEATCTVAGTKELRCPRDNAVINTDTIAALGHDSGAWHTTLDATCTAAGTKELRCTRDNYVLSSDTIAAGHIPNTETGLCTVCNALTYNLVDTGPGGGKIFYRLEAGFTVYQNATDTTGVTCHYLEAAPADRPGIYMWASSAFIPPPNGTGAYVEISGTGEAIGTGRKNTALILATDANAPAAKACNDYSNGGKTDWFLPSKDELNRLYVNRTSVGNMGTAWYWSSSQSIYSIAWLQGFSSGDQGTNNKHGTNTVRAVRAF